MADIPQLLHRDADLWILHKPSGWVVHPTNDPEIPDLIGWAREELGAPSDLAPVHRIDRDTSGLVLYSADAATRGELGRHFAQAQVEKRYLALVYGSVQEKGEVRKALKDARRGKALEALTRYEPVEDFGTSSLLSVRPTHGRKHQIRRHLQGIGHGIVGDRRYKPTLFLRIPGFPGRLWLHAAELTLPDERSFASPLPPELEEHLELLRRLRAEG